MTTWDKTGTVADGWEVHPVELDDQGYDDMGSYWGVDAPLWYCIAPDGETYHERAESAHAALLAALEINERAYR